VSIGFFNQRAEFGTIDVYEMILPLSSHSYKETDSY